LLSLNGKIDRLDIAEADGDKAVVVFDYKRKEQYFSWSKFYYGLDMQLPIYMLAVRGAAHSKAKNAAGAFYMPVETKIREATLDELSEKAERFSHKAKGVFNGEFARQLDKGALRDSQYYNFYVTKDGQTYGMYGDRGALKPGDFQKVLQFAEGKIVRLAEGITSGKIDVKPYRLGGKSPCNLCKYKPVCRFDWQINDYNFWESLNKQQCLERMGTVDG